MAIRTHLILIPAIFIRTFDISPLVCRHSTCCPVEWSTSCIRSLSRNFINTYPLGPFHLHHCYFLIIKTHLSINPFMNLISRNACDLRSKAHKIYFAFTHFECPPLKLTTHKATHTIILGDSPKTGQSTLIPDYCN